MTEEASAEVWPERPTVRILLIGPSGRVLMIRYIDESRGPGAEFWLTPGGGVDPGESLTQAARRELAEETGVTDALLGPAVWYDEPVVTFMGKRHQIRQTYFVAHCASETLKSDGWTDEERETIREMRWLTPGEISGLTAPAYPHEIAGLLPDVIAGRYPDTPLVLKGRRP